MLVPSFYSANKENVKRNSTEGKILRERIIAWSYSYYCTPILKSPGGKDIWSLKPQMYSSVHIIYSISGAKGYFDFFNVNVKLTSISSFSFPLNKLL